MKRRRIHFQTLFSVAVVLFLHMAVDGFVYLQQRSRTTTPRSATTNTNNTPLKQNQTEILLSYLSNIQTSRRHVQNNNNTNTNNKQHLLKPAKSFASFLSSQTTTTTTTTTTQDPLLIRTAIQSIRLASALNDYRLILHIVNSLQQQQQQPRILGEAVRGLATTSCSVGKIKALWSRHSQWTDGSLEINAMLEAMICQRKKIRVALELYQEAFAANRTDSYSLSILFKGLASVVSDTRNSDSETFVCWQWNEAVSLLEQVLHNDPQKLANPTIAALLTVNDRANKVFGRQHDGATKAISLMELLQRHRVSLDVITCTILLSQLQGEWKTALQILHKMKHRTDSLPEPNARVYAAVMAVCARAGRYREIETLLEEMKNDERNTYMYNSLLQAIATAARHSKSRERKQRMIDLWNVFQLLCSQEAIAPDTVTYNTILSGIGTMTCEDWPDVVMEGFRVDEGCRGTPDVVHQLLEMMERTGVSRDERTYVHSFQAMAGSSLRLEEIQHILELSINDLGHNQRIYNAALATTLSLNNLEATQTILSKTQEVGLSLDSDTITVLVDALCAGDKTKSIPFLFDALLGDTNAQRALASETGLMICSPQSTTNPAVALYSHAISQCLVACDFETARTILDQVKRHGFTLSDEALEKMARAYALSALSTIKQRTKSRARRKIATQTSRSRAENALSILSSIDRPALKSLALVSKACAGSGLFDEAQDTLRKVHTQFLNSHSSQPALSIESRHYSRTYRSDKKIVRDLHTSLMQNCAKTGNIALALRLCEDIQYLAAQIAWLESPQKSFTFPNTISSFSESTHLLQEVSPISQDSLGMTLPDWKSLVQAAAKSGHWKVCLSTLHILRPYVEESCNSSFSKESEQSYQAKNYKILSTILGTVIACLCGKNQSAWVIRTIDDWILWSGRRPRHQVVAKAFRLLSSKGQHDVVASLLSRSISVGSDEGPAYEIKLAVEAISTLYKDGHYVAADDIFLLAITNEWLPFDLKRQDGEDGVLVLDLHGMNLPVAHSAVRIAFQQGLLTDNWSSGKQVNDMVIVTGRGRNSALQMRPILRPAVQRMLVEEFYPPIGTTSVPGNMGALRISSRDISSWLQFQRQQKGVRMIEVATALKKLSSGSALRAILRSKKLTDHKDL